MNKDKKTFIIANWKMNPPRLSEAKKIYSQIKTIANKMQNVQTVIAPPFVYLAELSKITKGHRVVLSAQNVFDEKKGAYTGEISIAMLKDLAVQYVILGHSERRSLGESNENVNKKIILALKEKMKVVLCIGEKERDEAEYLHFLRNQIINSLADVPKSHLKNLLIAYEPIWAIGEGAKADTPEDTQETILFIRKVLSEVFDKKTAMSMSILYGGSIDNKNARDFLEKAGVQGLLIGRASLNAKQFGEILKVANL